jgi:uncharacterized pyridoxamine 5'-phosphate oxidase family protein
MKKLICLLSVLLLAAGTNRIWASDIGNILKTESKEEQSMQEVYDFLKKCGHYFIATVDGDQPRVRPFGTAVIFEGKLYIQTGKKKNVSRQMKANPKIEICALDLPAGKWLRIAATVVTDDRQEAKQYVLDQYPELKSMYSVDDNNTHVLYLKDVTATFSSFAGEPREVKF